MITRRTFTQLTLKGVAALLALFPTLFPTLSGCGTPKDSTGKTTVDPGDSTSPTEPLTYQTLLDTLVTLAEVQFTDGWDQEAYVADVALLLAALDLEDPEVLALYAEYADQTRNFPEITTVFEGEEASLEVAILQFEADDEIALHDHPDMTGVILCISGEVDVEHFDLLPEASESGALLLKRGFTGTLRGGDIASLTVGSGNIHALRARAVTELLDVFTPGYNRDRSSRSRWFSRAEEPVPGSEDTYEAWES